MITLTFTGPDPESLTPQIRDFPILNPVLLPWMKSHLEAAGYVVELPREWESIQDFCARVGIHRNTFTRCLKSPRRPRVDVERGPLGRIIAVASNTLFESFCVAGKGRNVPVSNPDEPSKI